MNNPHVQKTLTGDAFVFVGDLLRLFHPRGQAVDLGFGGFFVAFQSVGHRGHRADDLGGAFSRAAQFNAVPNVLVVSLRLQRACQGWADGGAARDWGHEPNGGGCCMGWCLGCL